LEIFKPLAMSKILKFIGHDLGINVTLMLTFAPEEVCWRVIKLGKANHVSGEVIHSPHTAFLAPLITPGNMVIAETWQECAIGQTCDLMEEEGFFQFTQPVTGDTNVALRCTNKTSTLQSLGVGYYHDETIAPFVIIKGIGANGTLDVEPISKLSIYSTSDYKESQLITSEIKSPKLWEQDLTTLVGDVITLKVSVDPATGDVSLNPD